MPTKKKKFITKKTSATYTLQPRSQKDPLVVDHTAPQNVLCPAPGSKVEFSDMRSETTAGQLRRWQKEYNNGIHFEDDYNYLQHMVNTEKPEAGSLRNTRSVLLTPLKEEDEEQTSMMVNGREHHKLPAVVLPSEFEAEKSLLHKNLEQGLMLDMDVDIREMLDDDFDGYDIVENVDEVDNDDCELGEVLKELEGAEEVSDADSRAGDFDDDRTLNGSNDGFCSSNDGNYDPSDDDFYQENEDAFMDRQTCFSKMSMQSASVMRRNGGLQMVDKQFEVGKLKMMHGNGFGDNIAETLKYNDDLEDFESGIDPETFISQARISHNKNDDNQKLDDQSKKAILAKFTHERDHDEDLVPIYKKVKAVEHDCVSILSTYSNIYNHPKRMDIKLPERKNGPKKETVKSVKEAPVEKVVHPSAFELSQRNKNETKEEKKARQKAFKAAKKDRRAEKKENQNKWKDAQKKRKGEVQVLIEKNPQIVKL